MKSYTWGRVIDLPKGTLHKDTRKRSSLPVDLVGFHSTDSKTLDHEDPLDHQESKSHSVPKRSVVK